MQNDSLRTSLCAIRMSHKNTKHFSPEGNFIVSARVRNTQQSKCAAKESKLHERSSLLKDNLSKCNKGKLFSLIFFIICRNQEIDEFVSPQIFHLPEYY